MFHGLSLLLNDGPEDVGKLSDIPADLRLGELSSDLVDEVVQAGHVAAGYLSGSACTLLAKVLALKAEASNLHETLQFGEFTDALQGI